MSDFQTFIESVQHVPTEFERSINLVKELDTRISNFIGPIKKLEERYKQTRSRRERLQIRQELDKYMQKLDSLGQDKTQVVQQAYNLVDKTVESLELLATNTTTEQDPTPIAAAMPIDPNEPRYCYCRGVSYGKMIACENPECPTEWFHFGCAGLKRQPPGKWYCMSCSHFNPQSARRDKKRKR